MELRLRHRMNALLIALVAHLGLLGLFYEPASSGAMSAGAGGLEVALGPAGAAPGGEAAAVPPSEIEASEPVETAEAAEPPPQPVETTPLETAPETPPDPATAEPVERVEAEASEPVDTVEAVEPEPEPEPAPQPASRPRPEPEPTAAPAEPRRQVSTPGAEGRSGSETQDNTGSGDNTSGGGRVGVSADYLTQLQIWLERHKQYPRAARRRRQQGTAMLYFVMDRDGRVLDYQLRQSTGHSLLDREVEEMIRRAQPLPRMPESMTQARLKLVVPVQFFLR